MNRRKVAIYLGGLAIQAPLAGGILAGTPVPLAVFAPLYMFTPAVAAVVAVLAVGDSPSSLDVTVDPDRWYLLAWAGPALVVAATIPVSLAVPGVAFDPRPGLFQTVGLAPDASPFLALAGLFGVGLIAGATVNAGFALGEEVGWRGLLQGELDDYGFWRGSAAVGVVWGLWHAPLVLVGHNYPGHPVLGVVAMTAFATLLSPLLAYVRYRSGSVIAAALGHGTLNGVAAAPLLVAPGDPILVGVQGAAGVVVLGTANLALYGIGRPAVPTAATPDAAA